MSRNSIAVWIADKEYRIRSDADEAWLQRVAGYVDESLRKIRKHTHTVDSLDVAILTALNLARELIELREAGPSVGDAVQIEPDQLAELIDFVEGELQSPEDVSQLNA
jgi:cell division protein ZapA